MALRTSTFALFVSLAAISASPLLVGCAGAADRSDSADDTDADEGALTATAKVIGTWKNTDGGAPSFLKLELREDRTFTASLDRGIRCIVAPCPSGMEIYGTFTAGSKTLTLRANEGEEASEYHGRYKISVREGGLTMTRTGARWTEWKNVMQRDTGIWQDDTSTIVASSKGGGFAPPAPPGSECRIGAQTYSFNTASRDLDWERCAWSGNGQPMLLETGSRHVTKAEATAIVDAVKATTEATRETCGADKPLLEVTLTTPAGTSKYLDSFYQCQGGANTYVDNIDGIFRAMRDASH